MNTDYKLTEYAHGAGCGCKIAPQVLSEILQSDIEMPDDDRLLVGNSSRDDAAVYRLDNRQCLISTTDFFTPIVNNAFDFGRIAAANAISDVYAMGGNPLLALAVLGWPVDKLPAALANEVIRGAKAICKEAGIPLAGGHSIDNPEPVFGLSVSGLVTEANLKRNHTASAGDLLFLTKPIGVGILATAEKRNVLLPEHEGVAVRQMIQLNQLGALLGEQPWVTALTDVTGFGLAGHLLEMCGEALCAELYWSKIPFIENLSHYLKNRIIPDATYRNWNGYGSKIGFDKTVPVMDAFTLLPDPQTNGGLLIAVQPSHAGDMQALLRARGLAAYAEPVGIFTATGSPAGDHRGDGKTVMVLP
jgi:selenide, water dikinase